MPPLTHDYDGASPQQTTLFNATSYGELFEHGWGNYLTPDKRSREIEATGLLHPPVLSSGRILSVAVGKFLKHLEGFSL